MKNKAFVINALSGAGRPKSAHFASRMLNSLIETADRAADIGAVKSLLDSFRDFRDEPHDTVTCAWSLCVGLPESIADVLNHGKDRADKICWDEFAVGCLEALAFLEKEAPQGLAGEDCRPLKSQIESAFASLIAARCGRTSAFMNDKLSGKLANVIPAFVKGYNPLRVLQLIKEQVVNWNRVGNFTPAPFLIIEELCRKTFSLRPLDEQIATLLRKDKVPRR